MSVSPFANSAPVRRLHAKRIEQMLVDVRGSHAHGAIAGEEVLLAGRERADCRKRSIELAILEILGRRHPEFFESERRELRGRYISRSGSGYPSGRRMTPFTIEKIAVLAPMPSASVSTATVVKPGLRRSMRSPCRTSRITSSSHGSPR